ncbi:MAG: helix-turn-helix transcriptional regulator [Clostridia bacterium]|nr:helix-turn-helix transcriptional regulator [Clostridia bacterium]
MNTVIRDVFSVYEYSTDRLSWRSVGEREHHILSLQLSGCYEHTVMGEVMSVRAGTVFFINKSDGYSVRCIERGRSLCVSFSADTDIPTSVYPREGDVRIEKLFKGIMSHASLERESNKYYAAAKIYELLSIITEGRPHPRGTDVGHEAIFKAHEIILDNYRVPGFNAGALYTGCGVGEKQFTRIFRSLFGISPTQLVIELRMNTAARLIGEGYMSVSEVAEFVGYDDVFYFSRLFKKHFSLSPTKYRMSQSGIEPKASTE